MHYNQIAKQNIIQTHMHIENNSQFTMVSVIITTYNRETTISETIDSVLNQNTSFKLEIIIGDDFSTDNTRNILRSYEKEHPQIFKIIYQKHNIGVAANWASCIKLAQGKYIATCDDDDFWHCKDKLKLQVEYLEKNEQTVLLHTDKDNLFVKNNKISPNVFKNNKTFIPQGYIQNEIFEGKAPICFSTNMFRKDIIDKYINLDDYIKLNFGLQDWPTWVIVAHYGKVDYLPISTCTYRIGNPSILNIQNFDKQLFKLEQNRIMYKYVCNLFPEKFQYDENGFTSHINNVMLSMAYKKFNYIQAVKYANQLKSSNIKNSKVSFTKTKFEFYLYSGLLMIKKVLLNSKNM